MSPEPLVNESRRKWGFKDAEEIGWLRSIHLNESRTIFECVMSHIWLSHELLMNESRIKSESVTNHIWIRHEPRMNSHEPCMNEPRTTYEWVMNQIWVHHEPEVQSMKPRWDDCNTLGCNNGIGGFHKNIVTFWGPKLPDFEISQKMRLIEWLMHFFRAIKKLAGRTRGAKTQNSRRFPQNRPSPAQNISETKLSCIFQQLLNRDKYIYLVLWVK